jgi:hypothetical protein
MLSKMSLSNDVFVQLVLSKPKREIGRRRKCQSNHPFNIRRCASTVESKIRTPNPVFIHESVYAKFAAGVMAFDCNLLKLQMNEI